MYSLLSVVIFVNRVLLEDTTTLYVPFYKSTYSFQTHITSPQAASLLPRTSVPGRMGKREVVVNFWTKEEFDRILAAMEDNPTAHVSFSLMYYSGIRFGEFLALTPKDFDFEKKTLDITKSLQRIKKQDVVTPPKTPNSIRNIIIPDFVMNEVKDYMSKPYDLKDTDKVFPFTKSYINNAMERACTKRYRPP